MSGDPNKLRIITQWLGDLSDLCRHPSADPMTPAKLKRYAVMLEDEFPSNAYTPASLKACVAAWFPSYVEIKAALAEWWNTQELSRKYAGRVFLPPPDPVNPPIPLPRAPPTEAEKLYVGDVIDKFRADYGYHRSKETLAVADTSKPLPLSAAQLLAVYEKIAASPAELESAKRAARTRIAALTQAIEAQARASEPAQAAE